MWNDVEAFGQVVDRFGSFGKRLGRFGRAGTDSLIGTRALIRSASQSVGVPVGKRPAW